jgi:N-acetylneuraminic acid mutarotase
MKFFYPVSCFIFPVTLFAQENIKWKELPSMPMAVSNNAVAAAAVGKTTYVYSFGGIDTSKKYSGITQKSFRYKTRTKKWAEIPSLPDTLGKIASAASTVKNKIYIIGGYHVFKDGTEKSSSKVHIYDPSLNDYLPDGDTIPGGIDDHVQAVWRDSLIYVITGWSQNNNVNRVWFYNTVQNKWTTATSLPDTKDCKVFGGSGIIIGDTIYYTGGAYYDKHYPLGKIFRKGIIDKNDPAKIEWLIYEDSLASGYRMASFSFNNSPFWIGGSLTSYNYNGIAYNGSGGVLPGRRLLEYKNKNIVIQYGMPPVMDLRNIAVIDKNNFVIAGGMGLRQKVSSKVYLITIK